MLQSPPRSQLIDFKSNEKNRLHLHLLIRATWHEEAQEGLVFSLSGFGVVGGFRGCVLENYGFGEGSLKNKLLRWPASRTEFERPLIT